MTVVRYRRPAALERLGQRHAVVEASAGTGKTYVLEHLVVDLLLRRDVELEQILVVTFTEKATAELVERLRAKLAELRDLGPDDPAAREGAAAPPEACWTLDARARQKLGRALLAFDRACVSTIHGFCQRILSEYAFLNRRLFDEEAVDEHDAFHAAFVEAIRRDVAPDPERGALLDAWLRSGQRLERLEGLLLRARRELACLHPPRPEALRPAPLDPDEMATALRALPALGEDLLRFELKKAGVRAQTVNALVSRWPAIAEVAAAFRAGAPLARCLAELERLEDGDRGPSWLVARLEGVPDGDGGLPAFAAALRRLVAARVPLAAELAHRVLPLVEARLETRKREAGLFDFQDMLTLLARALEGDGPRARTLVEALRGRFRHALIDEFQDTDEVQWSIFRRLFVDGTDRHVVTVIGDPKQAIYAFRGADVHTYLRARRELLERDGAEVPLDRNFRSTGPLVDAYNAILDQQGAPPFFRAEGEIRYDRPVACGRPALALTDASGEPAPPVVVLDVEARAPGLLTWQVKQALQARMVEELRRLLSDEGHLRLDGERAGASDIFVLTRTTRESREVGDALRAARIPFAFFKQERLFETVEAREVLDLLRAIADPDDRTARARAWVTGFFGLSLPELAACEALPPAHPLVRRLWEWKALADAGAFEDLFARVVEESGILRREVFLRDSERQLTNYLHVLEILQEEAARSRTTARELAQALGAYVRGARKPPGTDRDIQRLETDQRAVQIMTIHHAKGLEAAVVFLYGGFWPGGGGAQVRVLHDEAGRRRVRVGPAPADEERRIADEGDDEERRVLYVALTRARGRLYLPRYPREFKQLRGSYRFVNARLEALLDGLTPPEVRRLFAREAIACPGAPPAVAPPPPPPVLAAWRPPAVLLDDDPAADEALRALGGARAGFHVTSYSAVKRRHGGFVPAEAAADEPAANELPDPEAALAPLPAGELPRGRLSGSFLHEVLEEVPLDGLRGPPPLDAWRARPEIAALLERLARRHDRRPEHLPHAARLVHTALTAPVRLGERVLAGIASAAHVLREMEFLYPIPERGHRLLGGGGEGWTVERGVVKGFIDVLFEHEGRVYVCDWKGDWLPSWDGPRLREHCARNYDVQARLYTVAALRLLGVADPAAFERRFGGVVYCFLRGMRPDDPAAGVHFARPAWAELLAWEREMLDDTFWRLG